MDHVHVVGTGDGHDVKHGDVHVGAGSAFARAEHGGERRWRGERRGHELGDPSSRLDRRPAGGWAEEDRPGLGLELNPDVVKAHLASGETYWN